MEDQELQCQVHKATIYAMYLFDSNYTDAEKSRMAIEWREKRNFKEYLGSINTSHMLAHVYAKNVANAQKYENLIQKIAKDIILARMLNMTILFSEEKDEYYEVQK